MTARIAVVGAGVAGAAAAYALGDADASVTLFEARERVGGRTATRRTEGCVYDCGANYVKTDDERVAGLIERELSEGLVDVEGPVWTFDAAGTIEEGDDPDERKWTYRSGLATLAERLIERSDARVRTGTAVEAVRREGDAWRARTADGDGEFDAVVLTPPAPAAADLLGDAFDELAAALAAVSYRPIHSVALGYPFELERPYYALVNVDRDHEIGWLAREECKPGHVPDGESLLIVQMAPDWSAARADDPAEDVAAAAARLSADLLGDERLAEPAWTDLARWDLALPDEGVESAPLDRAADANLYVAGDWVAGEGRIHAALASGLSVGEELADGRGPA